MPTDITAEDYEYDTDTNILKAPPEWSPETNSNWSALEKVAATELDAEVDHEGHGDLILRELWLSRKNPLNPSDRWGFYRDHIGEVRSSIVRCSDGRRGRFQFRKGQHESMMEKAEHLTPFEQDKYVLCLYEPVSERSWRLVDLVELTAPELDSLRNEWTWTYTSPYFTASITWSKIPGFDPLQIEQDQDGYWTLDEEE